MKETINVNIGSMAFTLDQDAYEELRCYLDDIRRHLPAEDHDTMDDIERGIAETLSAEIHSPMHVVTYAMIMRLKESLGAPSCFGEESHAPKAAPQNRRIVRLRKDRILAGICGGLGEYFNLDPALIRLIALILIVFGGISIWLYVILWILIPEEPLHTPFSDRQQH